MRGQKNQKASSNKQLLHHDFSPMLLKRYPEACVYPALIGNSAMIIPAFNFFVIGLVQPQFRK